MDDAIRAKLLGTDDFSEFQAICRKNDIAASSLDPANEEDVKLMRHFSSLLKTPSWEPGFSPPDPPEAFRNK